MRLFFFGRKSLIALLLLAATALGLAAWAFWLEPASLTVKRYRVDLPELDRAFDNYKIVAISDVHGGSNFVDAAKIRRVVELANAENPDLIVLLGDFVSQQRGSHDKLKMPIADIADILSGLKAKNGVFAVLGNHDWWYSERRVEDELERAGIHFLNPEAIRIEKDEQAFVLLGMPEIIEYNSPANYRNDVAAALAAEPDTGAPVIALVHNPDAFVWLFEEPARFERVKLMLAGHTHGGQCDFPVVGSPIVPSSYGQKYAKGLIEENGKKLFVTPGIGTSVFPVRFRVPPEISVLTVSSKR